MKKNNTSIFIHMAFNLYIWLVIFTPVTHIHTWYIVNLFSTFYWLKRCGLEQSIKSVSLHWTDKHILQSCTYSSSYQKYPMQCEQYPLYLYLNPIKVDFPLKIPDLHKFYGVVFFSLHPCSVTCGSFWNILFPKLFQVIR